MPAHSLLPASPRSDLPGPPAMTDPAPPGPHIQSVARALALLEALNRRAWSTVDQLHRDVALPKPTVIRMLNTLIDAGYVAKDLRQWLVKTGAKTLYIEPGSPWENGYCESFNSKLRDEFLNGEIFYSMKELRVLAERWRVHYNTVRPHSSLGYRPPAPEAWQTEASQGHGEVESTQRFLLAHTPDDGSYLNSTIAALN